MLCFCRIPKEETYALCPQELVFSKISAPMILKSDDSKQKIVSSCLTSKESKAVSHVFYELIQIHLLFPPKTASQASFVSIKFFEEDSSEIAVYIYIQSWLI